jgi:hypothetical protein
MDECSSWLATPADAYQLWQQTDATGADGRAFSARSVKQHAAMFDRFMRHLAAHPENLATFGPAVFASFLADIDRLFREPDAQLFPALRTGKAMSDMMLIKIVRLALEAIDFRTPDMSPRVLRNTYARRLLLAARTNSGCSGSRATAPLCACGRQ